MRLGLFAAAALLTTLATASSHASLAPRVSVSVRVSQPIATGGGPLGQREFTVAFHVSASSDASCENLSVAYSYGSLFNGRPSLGEIATESFDTGAPATSAVFDVPTTASPAETIAFSARGACEAADGTALSASTRVRRTVRIPSYSCDQGPLRVFALRGRAHSGRAVVRRGHHLHVDDAVALAPRSRIGFGAPECGGLRISIAAARGASIRTGGYSRSGRGVATIVGAGAAVDFRGDRHAGGIQTPSAIVLPRPAARVAVTTPSRAVTIVRVRTGAALAAPRIRGSLFGKRTLVRAGGAVRCSGRVCR